MTSAFDSMSVSTMFDKTKPYREKAVASAKAGGEKAVAVARAGRDKADEWHNAEPVAIINCTRLLVLAAMSFGLKLSGNQLLASMAAAEAVLTLWTRSRVSPRHYERERRVAPPPA
jgi:hypothetical protein